MHALLHAVDGEWFRTKEDKTTPDPLNGEPFLSYPITSAAEAQTFVDSLRRVPKTGLHNPLKNPDRYLLYGAISARMAEEMRKPEASAPHVTSSSLHAVMQHCVRVKEPKVNV